MDKKNRIILFGILLFLLCIIFKFYTGNIFPTDTINVVVFSSLVLLAFTTLFLEHFFTKPTDVLASTASILLLISPLSSELDKLGLWYHVLWFYNFALLVMAFVALFLLDKDQSSQKVTNRISNFLKQLCVYLGNGKFLYFTLFVSMLLFYIDSQSPIFLWLFGYATVILLIQPHKIKLSVISTGHKKEDIGELFCVQAGNVFLVKSYKNTSSINKFDLVRFSCSISDRNKVQTGLVIDKYLLDREQWIKVLCDPAIEHEVDSDSLDHTTYPQNVVYRLRSDRRSNFLQRLVGVIVEKSTIDKIRFEYIENINISEGDLLEVFVRGDKVIYQVVQGITNCEQLEAKNESGTIIGEAVQLGTWDQPRRIFEKCGWVPQINSPVLIVSDIESPALQEGEKQIGTVPNTNYPVIMSIPEAVKHHIAILGVTGTGKSVFARRFISQITELDMKVICVDFTQEYKNKIPGLNSIISHTPLEEGGKSQAERIFESIDWISNQMDEFANKQDKPGISKAKAIIFAEFQNAISNFMSSADARISLFELPDVSNTTGILEYTKWFFHTIFFMAKNRQLGKKLCIIIEEAHTVIPEWNFIGERDKHAGSLVNAISQIALQGRKYDIGFVIIAQRTANVSKTVLTQCNTVIAFQQFDKTSTEFLANYMGTAMAETLPSLKFRQAIAVGRGFRSGVPMIFEVPFINEEVSET